MEKRIKELRKSLGLTQQAFADRIGIKRTTLANYEIGRNIPINAVIALICREFGANKKWLLDGEGEMFTNEPWALEQKQGRATMLIRALVDEVMELLGGIYNDEFKDFLIDMVGFTEEELVEYGIYGRCEAKCR